MTTVTGQRKTKTERKRLSLPPLLVQMGFTRKTVIQCMKMFGVSKKEASRKESIRSA